MWFCFGLSSTFTITLSVSPLSPSLSHRSITAGVDGAVCEEIGEVMDVDEEKEKALEELDELADELERETLEPTVGVVEEDDKD